MITFYFTCRPIRMGTQLISPKETLKQGFKGLKFEWECLASNQKVDGRWLYKVTCEDEEIRDVILEGLTAFGVHLKSSEKSAMELMDVLTEGQTKNGVPLNEFKPFGG